MNSTNAILIRLTIALLVTLTVNVFLVNNFPALVILLPFVIILSFTGIYMIVEKLTWMLDLPEQKEVT